MSDTVALIVAAGRGLRFGGATPKQYSPLAGKPLLSYSLEAFARHPNVAAVRAVIHPDDEAHYRAAAQDLTLLEPVAGGASRQESVRLGLESLQERAPSKVLIHDGARPFPAADLIDRVIAALETAPGALAALPVTDTLKRARDGKAGGTFSREGLWRAQTPQGFHYGAILEAHRQARGLSLTDDAAVAEAAGLEVLLTEGSEENFKVTTAEDLERARRHLTGTGEETRSGLGFDVHRFGPGDHVMLCGVRISHERGLTGHSDADVGIHAAVDAILGALGAGDIGEHFPPSEPRWKDATSSLFLEHAAALLRERGGRLVNLDITVICEQPRIGPHRAAMRARLAELLSVESDRIAVKATTTEGLGFTGRGEGIAAQAIASVHLSPGPGDAA